MPRPEPGGGGGEEAPEGLVLSPQVIYLTWLHFSLTWSHLTPVLTLDLQRRSFLSGCAAQAGAADPGAEVSLRPEVGGEMVLVVVLVKCICELPAVTPLQVPGKRVGSGRLLAREPEGPGERGFRRGEERREEVSR